MEERKQKAFIRAKKKLELRKVLLGKLALTSDKMVKNFEDEKLNIVGYDKLKAVLNAFAVYEKDKKRNANSMFVGYFAGFRKHYSLKEKSLLNKVNDIFNMNKENKEKLYEFSKIFIKDIIIKQHLELTKKMLQTVDNELSL